MAQCTAKVTGRHVSDDARRKCPVCGPAAPGSPTERLAAPLPASNWPTEQQRTRRGHNFFPPVDVEVPRLGETENLPFKDKTIVLHYFVGSSDWWIAEADPASGEAFGCARLNGDDDMAEWGYVDLQELESARIGAFGIVERDLDWEPTLAPQAGLPSTVLGSGGRSSVGTG